MKRAGRCCVCDRRPTSPTEGRRIDGSWAEDKTIFRRFQGRWVCCFTCYGKLPRVRGAGRKSAARTVATTGGRA